MHMIRIKRVVAGLLLLAPGAFGTEWRVGVARVDITPQQPTWMAGYAARKKLPEGAIHPLWGKALAIEDRNGNRAVIVTTDLIGMVLKTSEAVGQRIRQQFGLKRERIIFNSSHTHAGPLIRDSAVVAYGLNEQQQAGVLAYTKHLEDKLVQVIGEALNDLRPADLAYGTGKATFAMNRRKPTDKGYALAPNPGGPVDHIVPVLRVTGRDGNLVAVLFGYSCHNTTLGGNFYEYCGDYAGFAQVAFEAAHPGAIAFFVIGCGADINPHPRGTLKLARQHGESLGKAVEQTLAKELTPLKGPLATAFDRVDLPFVDPPSKEQLETRRSQGNVYQKRLTEHLLEKLDRAGSLPVSYPFPAQVLRFGDDLSIIALAGEVVVDYVFRLGKEFPNERVWVVGYCNEVFAYVPSERILAEGGYEGRTAMVYFGWHGPFKPGVENRVVELVEKLMERSRQAVRKNER